MPVFPGCQGESTYILIARVMIGIEPKLVTKMTKICLASRVNS